MIRSRFHPPILPIARPAAILALLAAAFLATSNPAAATTYPNIQVNSLSNSPEETAAAVNPINPAVVIGVAQIPSYTACRVYTSSDSGTTWGEAALPGSDELGDPSIVFDAAGTAYYAYIGMYSRTGIWINHSSDGGHTWLSDGVPVLVQTGGAPFEDKPYPCCDRTTGPRRGNVYLSWTEFDIYGSHSPADSTRILFSHSTDGGAHFSVPLRISDQGGDAVDSSNTVEGAVPAVGTDGTVYEAWAGPRGMEFDRSTDGGVTFGKDQVITSIPGGWAFDVPGIYRANGLPTTKVDLSAGPYRGRLYVCWSDQRNGDTDVFLISSDDGGAHWGPVVRVNDDPVGNGKDQFFPWIDVDPMTGQVYVVFYDRRGETDLSVDVYMAVSADGGATFTNEKISALPFLPSSSVFFGDYLGVSAYAGWVRPVWMRMDSRQLSLWTAQINPSSSGLCLGAGLAGGFTIYPNPVHGAAQIVQCASVSGRQPLVMHDVLGRMVRSWDASATLVAGRPILWDGRDAKGRIVPSGVYYLSMSGKPSTSFVVLR